MSKLCDCGDPVDNGFYQYHPACCSHDEVDVDDGRDGENGRIRYLCEGCGAELWPERDEDGGTNWVLAWNE